MALVDWHVAPAEHAAPALRNDALDQRLGLGAVCFVRRQEHHADAVGTRFRQANADAAARTPEERMGNLNEHSRAVARVRVGGDGASMGEVLEQLQGALDDLRRALALYMSDESNATTVVLVRWIVQTFAARGARGLDGIRRHAPPAPGTTSFGFTNGIIRRSSRPTSSMG